jgi:hypothetical protein
MNIERLAPVFAAVTLAASGLVFAQSTPPSATPNSPESVAEEPTPTASDVPGAQAPSTDSQSVKQPDPSEAKLQSCMARQRSQNSGLSDQQLLRACQYSTGITPHGQ